MPEIQNYPGFLIALVMFQIIPGAGTITILNATARSGVRMAVSAVCGMLTGDFIMMVSAMAGLATIMKAYPMLFTGLQWLGSAYVCWFGLQLLIRKVAGSSELAISPVSRWSYYRQALLVSISNPKVLLFFVAFFPLFLSPDASMFTLVVMMAHVTATSLIYQTLLVLAGNTVAQKLAGAHFVRALISKGAGLVLIGIGLKLAGGAGR